jgi:hypothetical protein
MAIGSFKLDKLLILHVPFLFIVVVWLFEDSVGAVIFPDEPDFVQKSLSILSKFVILMEGPLLSNPLP